MVPSLEEQNCPLPLAAASIAAHTWLSLTGEDVPRHRLSPSLLLVHATKLDQSTFGPHFLKLTFLATSLINLQDSTISSVINEDVIQAWAKLEYSCLLNVAEMKSEFLDVRDDMPATPAAVVTHMLQNLIYLRLYSFILCQRPLLGRALALSPVPGVLHFICAIARSTFVCQPQILSLWPLVADIQAAAAKIMFDFWNLTKFENCRALLNLWRPSSSFQALAQTISECLYEGSGAVEFIDGYSVFWTFRDVRSLNLEFMVS